ncbi:MAG: peptidoglycan -binding protein [Alphaproteobacteria bacterium]
MSLTYGRGRRRTAPPDIWPGFVDALASLLIVIIFLLMVFTVAQFVLREALSGRDRELDQLNRQISELAQILELERSTRAEMESTVNALSNELRATLGERDRLAGALEQAELTNRELLATLDQAGSDLAAARDRLSTLEVRAAQAESEATAQRQLTAEAQDQVALLNRQILALREQLAAIAEALEASEAKNRQQEVQITNLGQRLNAALATRVEELSRFRSEFFGRLRQVLGDRQDIRIVGDRFVFQSEVLFASGSDELGPEGRQQVESLARTLAEIAREIPPEINWILEVSGHTDVVPISTGRFPSNWELSTARAITVVKALASAGIPAERLSATGYGQFQPIDDSDDEVAFRRNRRIELKLTQR